MLRKCLSVLMIRIWDPVLFWSRDPVPGQVFWIPNAKPIFQGASLQFSCKTALILSQLDRNFFTFSKDKYFSPFFWNLWLQKKLKLKNFFVFRSGMGNIRIPDNHPRSAILVPIEEKCSYYQDSVIPSDDFLPPSENRNAQSKGF